MAHTHNNFIHVGLGTTFTTIPTPASVGMPTPARALFVPTPPEEGIINCENPPDLRKRKRFHTPHDKTKRILKRGGFPLTPHEEEEEEEEGEEDKETPPMDGEEKE